MSDNTFSVIGVEWQVIVTAELLRDERTGNPCATQVDFEQHIIWVYEGTPAGELAADVAKAVSLAYAGALQRSVDHFPTIAAD